MTIPAANTVTQAYTRIAAAWRADRLHTSTEASWQRLLDRLTEPLATGAHVLDVGCGCGEPMGTYLTAAGYQVTGIDGSAGLLSFARKALPQATFHHGDMRTVDPGGSFDAIVAWDSLFHVPRTDHAVMFARFATWLQPGGRLLLSLGASGDAGFTAPLHGETMYYSSYSPRQSMQLLREAGLLVEHREIDDPGGRGHLAIIAVKSSGEIPRNSATR